VSLSPWTRDSRPEWFDRAACREQGVPVQLFYPSDSGSSDGKLGLNRFRDSELAAKQICRDCPVRSECLTYGLDEPFGVWGGRTYRERRHMTRTMRGATA
jgi:WhiB family redox-sensing transcriptional regulator